jgi:hypothetical protein
MEEFAEMFCGNRNGTRRGDTDAIEAERVRFSCKRSLDVGAVQKSRST